MHSDLSSYVCTFENCREPLFENRRRWFQHEMEVHRRQWSCHLCTEVCHSAGAMETHLREKHLDQVQDDQVSALAKRLSQPLDKLRASDCPFCDYHGLFERRTGVIGIDPVLTTKAFSRHAGRHLEQLALFVLPWQDLAGDGDEDDDDKDDSEDDVDDDDQSSVSDAGATPESSPNAEKGELEDSNKSTSLDLLAMLASEAASEPIGGDDDDSGQPPKLAMRWQPPHDFTPPEEDFEIDDPDLLPLRQEPIYGGDLFTPGWARGPDTCREGFCARCATGHWVNMTEGRYEFHMTHFHGVPSSGVPLPRPPAIRESLGEPQTWEGYCDACQAWKVLKKTNRGWTWYRHWLQVSSFACNPITKPD